MKEPVNLTMNGRKNRISYRLVKLDKEERVIDLNKPQLLKGCLLYSSVVLIYFIIHIAYFFAGAVGTDEQSFLQVFKDVCGIIGYLYI